MILFVETYCYVYRIQILVDLTRIICTVQIHVLMEILTEFNSRFAMNISIHQNNNDYLNSLHCLFFPHTYIVTPVRDICT